MKTSAAVALAVGALVVGLEAPAMAHQVAHKIGGSDLKPNSVTGKQIKESSLGVVPVATTARHLRGVATHRLKLLDDWIPDPDAHHIPAYSVDAQGYVHLEGSISSGGLLNTAFKLPTAARPVNETFVPILEGGGYVGVLDIATNGIGTVNDSIEGSAGIAKVHTGLDGVTFPIN